ncbi:MAG: 3-hydroxyacyl-CoA dehydrogenase NAD-binding domain-containing protein [Haliscomenobacter sp.]
MIRYQKDTDNIVTLTLDMENRSENVINQKIWAAFVPVIQQLKLEKKQGRLRGVILTSGKKTFMAGGDLEYIYQAQDADEIFAAAEGLKNFLRELESPGVPVVAAINGSALGAGFEVALGCHHRIVLDDPHIQVGLPEVEIGLIPAGGSIVRLMWLLGLEKAFPILAAGRRYDPRAALQAGIIDEIAQSPKEMMQKARAWLLRTREGRRPWDTPGREIPGGTAKSPAVARKIMEFSAALNGKNFDNYPAPRAVLHILTEASKVDFDVACRLESRYYTELVRSRQCKNMIKAFWFDTNYIEAGHDRPKGFGKFRPRQVGIIGAGLMGSGIALACLNHGLRVVLKDVSHPIAGRGKDFVRQRLEELVRDHILLPKERDALLDRLLTTDNAADFAACDLVIEAVFENQQVKQKVNREAETYLDEQSFFATNTVSIPIKALAQASSRPDRYIGLHFFHPASETRLVEIVRGPKTSEETISRAFDFVRAIGKTPILVKDIWGFFAARVQNTYLLEGIAMLLDGYPPAVIENLSKQAGMPRSPLALADELGLELVLRYEQQAAAHYGPRYIQHPAIDLVRRFIDTLDRKGKAQRSGFYDYPLHEQPALWPGLDEQLPPRRGTWDNQEIIDRLLIVQVLEALWCMQEGVIQSVAAANLGSIYGWGFPACKGGVIQFIEDYGKEAFQKKCRELEQAFGPRYQIPRYFQQLP